MSLQLRNTLAHAAGQFVYPVLSLLLVPFYLRRLGLEGYGVIGFLTLLSTLLGVFTRGLGTALQREMARRDADASGATLAPLLRLTEGLYWGIGALLAAGLLVASGFVTLDVGTALGANDL